MKDEDQLYIKYKTDYIMNVLESGTVKEELAQYAMVEQLIVEIFDKFEAIPERKKMLMDFLKKQIKLKIAIKEKEKKINDIIANKPENLLQKEAHELINTYGENMQKIYKIIKNEIEKINQDYV